MACAGVSVATGSVEAALNGKTVSATVTLQRAARPINSPCVDPAQCTTGVPSAAYVLVALDQALPDIG